MSTSVTITGKILRDRTDDARRNYESFVISTYVSSSVGKDHERHVHVSNYAANAKSSAHRMLTKSYSSASEALNASTDIIKKKLARDRIEVDTFSKSFTDASELVDYMQKKGLKLTVAQLATIKNDFNAFLATSEAKDSAMSEVAEEDRFAASIERQLSGEEMSELEERVGFGQNTKANNSGWGLF